MARAPADSHANVVLSRKTARTIDAHRSTDAAGARRHTQTLPAPRKSSLPLTRSLCGSVFPLLPATILPDVLHAILVARQPRTHTTEFVFEWTIATATHNLAVLRRYGGN